MGLLSGRGGRRFRSGRRRTPVEDVEVAYGKKLLADGWAVEAEKWLREQLAVREAVRQPDPRGVRRARIALVSAQLALNRPEEAAASLLAERTAADVRRWSAPAAAMTLRNLSAFVLLHCGRYSEAEAELAAVTAEFRASPAPGPVLLTCYFHSEFIAQALLCQQARFSEALAAADAILPEAAAALGADDDAVHELRMSRVFSLAMLGRYEEAAAECRALIGSPSLSGAGDPDRSDAVLGLAHCLIMQGRPGEAEELVGGLLGPAEQANGRGSGTAAMLRRGLAEALARQGRHGEALAWVEGAPAWGVLDAGHHELIRAEALFGLGRREEAEAAAMEALTAAGARYAAAHVRILEIRTLLARIRASGPELDAVTADWVTHYGPDHPRTRAAAGAAR